MAQISDKELWEAIKPHALTDSDFIEKMEERRIEGYSWKVIKFILGILLASITILAPAKVSEWVLAHINISGK
jgi:hypothetical protein